LASDAGQEPIFLGFVFKRKAARQFCRAAAL